MSAHASTMWGGRFNAPPDALLTEFGRSVSVDCRLLPYDLDASRAWARALLAAGVLSSSEHAAIDGGLAAMSAECTQEAVATSDVEDVHSWIEGELYERIGEPALKLHTGRSRNDQVMTAARMWLLDACDALEHGATLVARSLVALAQRSGGTVVPAYTHMQRAQPMLAGHWCLSWVEGFERDVERLRQVRDRCDVLPLGSGACVGTSVPVDREAIAADLGMARVSHNSLDAVADRDVFIDVAGACAHLMARLSRLAEDLLLWSGREYGFLTVADSVTTGSSLLPHKRNLDPMELVRGKAGRVFGHLQSLLVMSKGVPTAYARDLQEDKPAVFDAVDTVCASLAMTARVVEGANFVGDVTRAAAEHGYLEAMELADHLVDRGVPFRIAHQQVGAAVKHAEARGVELRDLSLDELRSVVPGAGDDALDVLGVDAALARRDLIGGTAPARVASELQRALARWT